MMGGFHHLPLRVRAITNGKRYTCMICKWGEMRLAEGAFDPVTKVSFVVTLKTRAETRRSETAQRISNTLLRVLETKGEREYD